MPTKKQQQIVAATVATAAAVAVAEFSILLLNKADKIDGRSYPMPWSRRYSFRTCQFRWQSVILFVMMGGISDIFAVRRSLLITSATL